MRVTTFGITNQYIGDLNNIMTKFQTLQRELSTGRKLNEPSDDPVAFSSDILTQTMMSEVQQWQDNAKLALSKLQMADDSMSTLQTVLGNIRTQLVQAVNGTNTPEDIRQIASVVSQQVANVEQIANTSDGEEYIFAGVNGTVKPMDLGSQTWSGSAQLETLAIGDGVTMPVGVDGKQLFDSVPAGGSQTLMAALNQIVADLQAANSPNLQQDLAELDAHINQVSAVRADLGGRMTRVQSAQTQLAQSLNILQQRKGQAEDADLAEVATQLATQQTVYQAALLSGQRMILPTLANVLS
ncbi:MAG: flagellar hook-associated protein FlgL [Alicyclobacillus sp.]|nr:flagellar hook-associated protein FlgL [Alicyclobacillus sp.]